ncbi:MAG: transcriptional repressor, partial [Variovorax sp.]
MARAEKLCRDRSLHFTKLRHDVLQAVAETGKPMGAYD